MLANMNLARAKHLPPQTGGRTVLPATRLQAGEPESELPSSLTGGD